MDVVRRIQRTFSILLFLLLVPQRPARGGFLFLASPGYDGIHPAGLWGGLLNHSSHGRAQDLFSQGYQVLDPLPDISLPTAYVYDGIRVDTLSYDPRTRTALVQVEDTKRGLSVVGRGAVCQGYGPYAYITSPDSSPNIPLITLLPDVRLVDRNNPYFLDAACGWRCGWGGFALFDDKIYFVLTAVFGLRRSELRRQVQIRVMTSACDDLIQKAIKYEQVDVELPILSCSDHVVTVLDHPYDSSHPVDTWVASPLKVVQEKSSGPMYFLLQLIQKADCDVTMSLVQTSRQSGLSTWVHNVSLPSIYGGNPQIRGFGSIDYRDGMLCWTAAEVLLCGPIAGDQVSLVSMLLPPGAAHTAGICSGDLPLAKVLTGVAVASSAPLRVYFGCYSELTGHGGAGLVEVNLSSASEIVKHVYPVTSAGRKVYASGLFFVDTLCGPCTENCGTGEQTTSFQKSTASGVSSLTSRPWMDGNAENIALTGCARTLVATLRTVVSLLIHIMIVLSLIL